MLRSLAGLTLALFVAGMALCLAHCSLGSSNADRVQSCCHGVAKVTTDNGHGGATPTSPASTSKCQALKTMLAGDALTLPVPQLQTHYLRGPITLALGGIETEPDTSFRPSKTEPWVFTPEVFLGPAFRSLAPPTLTA